MQLNERVIDRMRIAGSRFETLKRVFGAFIGSLDFFARPKCPVEGVTIAVQDGCFFKASFTAVAVGFRLLHVQNPGGVASAVVVCTLEAPNFTETKPPVIGSFTFTTQGETDFEVAEDEDKVHIELNGPEIVLHFINEALARSQPAPAAPA